MKALFEWIKKWFFICYNNDVLRYIFYGGLTTLVNWIVYFFCRKVLQIPLVVSNTISVITAILFAYIVNSRFVFKTKASNLKEHAQEFIKFISGRAATMIIEIGGVWLLVEVFHWNETLVKVVIIQVIILILNYFISKFFVFTKQ